MRKRDVIVVELPLQDIFNFTLEVSIKIGAEPSSSIPIPIPSYQGTSCASAGTPFGGPKRSRCIIQMLMCNFELPIASIEQAYPITFSEYFAPELLKLRELEKDGLLTMDDEWLNVSPA